VIHPEVKEVVSNGEEAIDGCPLKLMGPPVGERDLVRWCILNLSKLDESELDKALISAFTKTVKKKGFGVEKQRLHRSSVYRLKTDNGLIKEGITITKEE